MAAYCTFRKWKGHAHCRKPQRRMSYLTTPGTLRPPGSTIRSTDNIGYGSIHVSSPPTRGIPFAGGHGTGSFAGIPVTIAMTHTPNPQHQPQNEPNPQEHPQQAPTPQGEPREDPDASKPPRKDPVDTDDTSDRPDRMQAQSRRVTNASVGLRLAGAHSRNLIGCRGRIATDHPCSCALSDTS